MESQVTRRQHSDAAQQRLRRHVLTGLSIAGCLLGLGGVIVTSVDPTVDLDLALAFLPDAIVGLIALWFLLVRGRTDTATRIYAWFYVLNFAFFAVHAEGYRIFATTTFVVLPTVFGFYVGGRRLGVRLSTAIVVEGVVSVVVHELGLGHRLVAIPPADAPVTHVLMAIGVIWAVILVNVFERSRHRTHVALEQILGELDEQSETLLTVVESQRDVVLLLDRDHRVVLHNRAAAVAFPALSVGVALFAVVPVGRTRAWLDWLAETAAVGHVRAEEPMTTSSGVGSFEISFARVSSGERLLGFTLVGRDLTQRRAADAALRRMRGQLLDASRRAGRAEVAASVMHTMGNTLNGAGVSAGQLSQRLRGLRLEGLGRVAGLLRERSVALESVLGDRAGKLVAFLDGASAHLEGERAALVAAAHELYEQIVQVGNVLSAYERQPRGREVFEDVDLDEVIASALEAEEEAWRSLGLVRELEPTGTILTIRQKLLDVVIALLRHAREAKVAPGRAGSSRLTLRPLDADRIALAVTDHGAALDAAQALALLGHGAALHDAALAATALGGSLRHERAADGGNRFVLELPRVARRSQAA